MCVVWDISLGVQDFQVEPIVDQPCNDMVGEKGTLRDIGFKVHYLFHNNFLN